MNKKIYKIKDLASAMNVKEPYIRSEIKKGKIFINKEKGIQVVNLEREENKYLIERISKKKDKIIKSISAEDDKELEKKLWAAADSLRGNVDAGQYKNIVLSLIFLKYISDKFEDVRKKAEDKFSGSEKHKDAYINDPNTYTAEGAFFLPEEVNWDHIKKNAAKPNISEIIDETLKQIENKNEKLNGMVWREYTRQNIDPHALTDLINIFSNIDFKNNKEGLDMLGRVYEYFIGQFADSEGRRGGEFFTPNSLLKLIVRILKPSEDSTIFDPACGSGGFLVECGKYIKEIGGDVGKTNFNCQEYNDVTQKMSAMNMFIHSFNGISEQGNSYYDDKFKSLKADFVLANPPFNDNYSKQRLSERDNRFKYGLPNEGNANFIWIQHFISHLDEDGKAGFVMSNGSLTVGGKEGEIREKIIKDDLVEVVINCPSKLFYNVQIPCCVWILSKNKSKNKGKTLFIDASNEYKEISRKHNQFSKENLERIIDKVDVWESGRRYEDEKGFCYSATNEEIEKENFILSPGRYVGIVEEEENDGMPIETKINEVKKELKESFKKEIELSESIEKQLKNFKI